MWIREIAEGSTISPRKQCVTLYTAITDVRVMQEYARLWADQEHRRRDAGTCSSCQSHLSCHAAPEQRSSHTPLLSLL